MAKPSANVPVDRSVATFELKPEHDIRNRHGAFGWLELVAQDPISAAKFYSAIFGWNVLEMEIGGAPYWAIKLGDHDIGGIRRPLPHESGDDRWQAYVTVEDIDKIMENVALAGGTVSLPVTPLVGAGKLAGFIAPDGASLLAFEYERPFG